MMRKHDGEKQAAERFSKAVEAVLSYRRNLEHHAVAPIKEWIIETNPDTGVSNFPYARYQAEVYNFFTALGEFLDLWTPLATDYQETASRFQRDHDAIGTAGPDEVKALVTWVFRGERFCEGFWGEQLRDGLVTALLDRLYALYHSGEVLEHRFVNEGEQ